MDVQSAITPNLASETAQRFGRMANRGADRDAPVRLPRLQSDAVPLRFLDYLLRDTVEAAVLTKFGAVLSVPSPERYAVYKLILSSLRHESGESAVSGRAKVVTGPRPARSPA